jgi:hypothetical protein
MRPFLDKFGMEQLLCHGMEAAEYDGSAAELEQGGALLT